jgi:hypothetical protein
MSAAPTGKCAGRGPLVDSGATAKTKATTRPQRSGPGSSGRNRMSWPTSHCASRSCARKSRSGSPGVGRGGSIPAILSQMPFSKVNSSRSSTETTRPLALPSAGQSPSAAREPPAVVTPGPGPAEKDGEAQARPSVKADLRAREAPQSSAPKRANLRPLSFAGAVRCRTHLRSQPHGIGSNRFPVDEHSKVARTPKGCANAVPRPAISYGSRRRRVNVTGRLVETPPMPSDRRAFRQTRRAACAGSSVRGAGGGQYRAK